MGIPVSSRGSVVGILVGSSGAVKIVGHLRVQLLGRLLRRTAAARAAGATFLDGLVGRAGLGTVGTVLGGSRLRLHLGLAVMVLMESRGDRARRHLRDALTEGLRRGNKVRRGNDHLDLEEM